MWQGSSEGFGRKKVDLGITYTEVLFEGVGLLRAS